MTAISDMLQQPVPEAIGWALMQFIWQGALIGTVTAAVLAALRRSAADVRYVVSTIALALMLTTPIVTAFQSVSERSGLLAFEGSTRAGLVLDGNRPPLAPSAGAEANGTSPAATHEPLTAPASGAVPLQEWLPVFLACWLAGVAALTLRLLSGWMFVQRLRSHGAAPVIDPVRAAASRLARQLHITRTVQFLESSMVDVPTVIGWLKPVVLLPASALAGLTPRQLEAVLAHELAHIRRHDYLVNLLQTVVETLLFYHPAVWWLSRRIRIERENCCDDLAVSLCGDPVTYASALAELEGLRGGSSHLVLAASGGSLLHRVRRLLGAPSHAGRAPGWLAAAVAVLLIAGICAGAAGSDGLLRAAGAAAAFELADVNSQPPAPPPPPPAPPAQPAEPALPPPPPPAPPAQPDPPPAPVLAAGEALSAADSAAALAALKATLASTMSELSRAAASARAAAELARAAAAQPMTAAAPPRTVAAAAAAEAQAASTAASSSESRSRSERDGEQSGNYTWSENGHKVEVSFRGTFEFTDDDTDVRRLSPGGWLRIKDGRRLASDTTVEFRADADGNITRRFWAGSTERPFEPEGRKWLTEMLPRFIRQSGLGAEGRVARIYKARGADGVLAEITLVQGSWAKRAYFSHLLKMPSLNAQSVQQALAQAGREIEADFELASVLASSAHLVKDDGTRRSYLESARTVGSDFEMRRVLSSLIKQGAVSPAGVAAVLQATASIESDFEAASLLVEIVNRHPIEGDVRTPFFDAAKGIGSSFEHARVLQAAARRGDLSPATVLQIIRATDSISGGFEKTQVLVAVANSAQLDRAARDAYIDAAGGLGDFEQGRALSALVRSERR